MTDKIVASTETKINAILFGALYRRKISIKDWLFTKVGASIFTYFLFLLISGKLDGTYIAFLLIISLFMYNREKSLAYEKEQTVWLIKIKRNLFNELDDYQKKFFSRKSKMKEANQIIELCKRK